MMQFWWPLLTISTLPWAQPCRSQAGKSLVSRNSSGKYTNSIEFQQNRHTTQPAILCNLTMLKLVPNTEFVQLVASSKDPGPNKQCPTEFASSWYWAHAVSRYSSPSRLSKIPPKPYRIPGWAVWAAFMPDQGRAPRKKYINMWAMASR